MVLNVNWSNRSGYCSSLTSDDRGLPSSKSIFLLLLGVFYIFALLYVSTHSLSLHILIFIIKTCEN